MSKKILAIIITLFVVFVFLVVGEVQAGPEHNVSGWAWSGNLGWISFNCTNRGTCGTVNYGVNINSDGTFSGFAWLRGTTADVGGIGWIRFDPVGPYPATPNYSACLDLPGAGQVCDGAGDWTLSGWARAYRAIEPEGQTLGGWDGWIKLRGTIQGGGTYGVRLDNTTSPLEFRGYAWGGDAGGNSEAVVGWISFNCKEGGAGGVDICATKSNYKVITSFIFNQPPSATDLSVSQPDYCSVSWPAATFSWQFTDPDSGDSQSAYQIQVDNNSNFSSPEVDTGKILSSSNSYATLPGNLSWDTTYYWRLMVWDSKDLSSSWISGPSFTTPRHAYPTIDFSWAPQSPSVGENTQFTDQSTVYGGSTKSSWSWTFQDGNPANSILQNPLVRFLSTGAKSVTLRVTDSDGFNCTGQKTLNTLLPLPEYKEVPPIIWLEKFFAGIINFFDGFLKI